MPSDEPTPEPGPSEKKFRPGLLLLRATRTWGFWLVLYLVLLFVTWRFPGAWKWLPLGAAWVALVVAVMLFRKRWHSTMDGLERRARSAYARMRKFVMPHAQVWKHLPVLVGVAILLMAAWKAAPSWSFLLNSSLREDEILNIQQYTSRSFAKSATDYSLARNHIFYNLVNSLLPGGDSTWPFRARFVSLVSVLAGLGLMVVYAARKGWFLAGCFCAGLLAVNHFAMKTLLEARGYGLIFFLGILACIAFAEWIRTRHGRWLTVLAVTTVLGAYTLPYFVFFGGLLLLLAWAERPSRETFRPGFLAGAVLVLLYLPVATQIFDVATGYSEEYAERSTFNFQNLDGAVRIFQFFVPYPLLQVQPALAVLVLAAFGAFALAGRFAPLWCRISAGLVCAALLGLLAFFLWVGSVPVRTAAFLGGPLAFLFLILAGPAIAAPLLKPFRGPLELFLGLLALSMFQNATAGETLLPRQEWRTIAAFLQQAFPENTSYWTFRSYGPMIQWNLPGRPKAETGNPDRTKIGTGSLVAIDAEFHNRAEDRRLRREDLPDEVRFVTFPLQINYQRVYFLPPVEKGLSKATVNGTPLHLPVPGVQIPDDSLLRESGGHGDTLLRQPPAPGSTPANPPKVQLPFTLILEPTGSWRHANLLFNGDVRGVTFDGFQKDATGRWRQLPKPFQAGEFAGFRLGDGGEIKIEASGTGEAPGLLDVWMSP